MRHSVLRGSAWTAVTLAAVVALAKGHVDSQLSDTDEAGENLQTAFHDSLLVCAPSPPDDCQSVEYATSPCGKREASRIRRGDTSVCDETCDTELATLTVADCQNEAWLNTICGMREKRQMEIPQDPPCTHTGTCPGLDCVWSCPSHPSLCVTLIRAEEGATQGTDGTVMLGLEPREVVVPDNSAPGPDDGYGADILEKRAIRVNDEGSKGIYSGGTGRHYWSHGTSEAVAFKDGTAMLARQMIEQRHARWDNNGVALGDPNFPLGDPYGEGCREYIYEKYYDYSAFENRVRELGDTERRRFDVAFDITGSAPEYQPWAIGTRGLANIPLRRKDLQPNGTQVEFHPEKLQQKNTLFETPVHDTANARNSVLSRWESYPEDSNGNHDYVIPFNGESITVKLPRPFAGNKVFIVNGEIDAALRTGRTSENPRYRFNESWDWHRQTGTDLSALYLDEELYAVERFKERIAFLLRERSGLWLAYKKALEPMITIDLPPPELVEEGMFDPEAQVSDPFSQFFADQANAVAATAAASGLQLATGSSSGLGSASSFAPEQAAAGQQAMAGPDPGFGFGGALAGMGRQLASSTTTGSIDPANLPVHMTSPTHEILKGVRDAIEALVAQDAKIEAVLTAAERRGCLDLDQPNPCDWSPRTFAQRVEDPFMGAREIEYQRCLDYTNSTGFSAVPTVDDTRFYVDINDQQFWSVVDDGLTASGECRAGAYNADTDWVERYFACNDRYRQDIVETLNQELANGGVLIDPETGDLSIIEQTSDADTLGNDVFGISYSYGATWSVTGLPPPPPQGEVAEYCDLEPHLAGHFWADAHVLVADISLIDASGDVGLDTSKPAPNAHLSVLGEELITIDEPHSDPATFNIIAEETKQDKGDIFSIGATFVIVVVPVSLKGGITGRVGATAQLAAGSNGGGASSCKQGGMVLRATFEPFVGVDAFASVSIDAIIVEAGVKITVTVAQVSFPFTTDLKFTAKARGDALDVILDGTSNLSVVFSFLGGRFSAFVEFCLIFCEEFEETLFEWSGLVFKTTIFETHFEVPLFPLMEYQHNG